MKTTKIIVINKYLISAKNNRNWYTFHYFLKLECIKFLKSLTGNEIFYSELFRTYNTNSVHLNTDDITSNYDDCYDILTDYTEYDEVI